MREQENNGIVRAALEASACLKIVSSNLLYVEREQDEARRAVKPLQGPSHALISLRSQLHQRGVT